MNDDTRARVVGLVDRINARFRLARAGSSAPDGDPFCTDMERLGAVVHLPEDADPADEGVILEVLDTLERSYPAEPE